MFPVMHTRMLSISKQLLPMSNLYLPNLSTTLDMSKAPIMAPRIELLVLTSPQNSVSSTLQPNIIAKAGSRFDQEVVPKPNCAKPRVIVNTFISTVQVFMPDLAL